MLHGYCKLTFRLNIAWSVNDCAVGTILAYAVYIARMLTSVRALTSIAQASTKRTLHCTIIHATRNVRKFAVTSAGLRFMLITLCACARDKVIGLPVFIVVYTKKARFI